LSPRIDELEYLSVCRLFQINEIPFTFVGGVPYIS